MGALNTTGTGGGRLVMGQGVGTSQLGWGGHSEAFLGGDLLAGDGWHVRADLLRHLAAGRLVHLEADLLVLTFAHPIRQARTFAWGRNMKAYVLLLRFFAGGLVGGEALLGGHLLAVVHSFCLTRLVRKHLGHTDALLRHL